jgi:DNA repair exonuclease SbcCD ATPase subunit
MKNYYVFKYVFDPVKGEHTELEGEVQGYTQAEDPFEACDNLGLSDPDEYFAREIEDLDAHVDAIKNERKHLTKISKQLKTMTDERDKAREDFEKNRPCPNCGEKLDDNYNCDNCGFGHEIEDELQTHIDGLKEELGFLEDDKADYSDKEFNSRKKDLEDQIADCEKFLKKVKDSNK